MSGKCLGPGIFAKVQEKFWVWTRIRVTKVGRYANSGFQNHIFRELKIGKDFVIIIGIGNRSRKPRNQVIDQIYQSFSQFNA